MTVHQFSCILHFLQFYHSEKQLSSSDKVHIIGNVQYKVVILLSEVQILMFISKCHLNTSIRIQPKNQIKFVHKVQWNESQNNLNAWFNFIIDVDTCIVNNITQTKVYDWPTVRRSLADTGRLSADILWQNFIDWPSGDRLMPNDQGTFGRYHDAKFFKKSGNHRPTLHR